MQRSLRGMRRAIIISLGVTATTFSSGITSNVKADETGLEGFPAMVSEIGSVVPTNFAQDTVWPIDGAKEIGDEDTAEQDEDVEDPFETRFKSLEEKFAALEESIDEVAEKAGDKTIVKGGTSKSTMKISGRVHIDAWGFDNDEGVNQFAGGEDEPNRLGFRRLRFGVKGTVKDNMVYKIELELANGNETEFRDAFLGWTDLPVLQTVLLGNQKRPFGLDHLNSSRFNVFTERPFVIEAFNEDARRLGLQSYGVSEDKEWNWRYGVFSQRNVQDEGNVVADHLQLQLAGRLANTFWYDETSDGRGYGHWAISGSHADVSTDDLAESTFRSRPEGRTTGVRYLDTGQIDGTDFYNLIGLEGVWNVGALQLVGEYQSNWVERNGFEDVRLDGGYAYVSYFLTGEHIPWDRDSGTLGRIKPFQNFWLVDRCDGCREAGWGAWQIAARYSQADFTDEDIFGGDAEALTLGVNWYWNENARVQLNYIAGNIQDSTVGNRGAAPINGEFDIWGARFAVDF